VNYVSDEANRRALEFERRFTTLPPQAGVIFASVQAQPVENGKSVEYFVRLGLVRRLEEETGRALARKILDEEIHSGFRIFVGVYRGSPGACRDDSSPAAHPLTS